MLKINNIDKPYKVYLATNGLGNAKKRMCEDLEQVQNVLENETDYNEYLVLYHDFEKCEDIMLMYEHLDEVKMHKKL